MSYHGGLIGVIIAAVWYCKKSTLDFWEAADLFVPGIPLGYTFGRLGNFINGELYGRTTQQAIGMHFPSAPGDELRHPTQLYEAFFEGIFLFVTLWYLRRIKLPKGAMIPIYLLGYGVARFFIEFFREPDAHIGFVVMSLTMGQLLCAAMIAGSILLYIIRNRP
jgi:phosphatidylglycerol:prolipoprotein diacylglycerol transferase